MCTHYRNSPCLSSILMCEKRYHPYSWYIINYGIHSFFPSSIYKYQVVWANTTTSTQSIFYGIQYYVASFLHHRCLTFLTYNGYRTHFRPNIGRKINSGNFFIIYKYILHSILVLINILFYFLWYKRSIFTSVSVTHQTPVWLPMHSYSFHLYQQQRINPL